MGWSGCSSLHKYAHLVRRSAYTNWRTKYTDQRAEGLARDPERMQMVLTPGGGANTLRLSGARGSVSQRPQCAVQRRLEPLHATCSLMYTELYGSVYECEPRHLVRRPLGCHPTRSAGAARTCRGLDYGARREIRHDPHGHEEAHRRPGEGRARRHAEGRACTDLQGRSAATG